MNVILGQSHQIIQMRQSGFNADQKSIQLIIRRVTTFLTSDFAVTNVIFNGSSPSPKQHLRFPKFMTDSTVRHVSQGMDDILYITEVFLSTKPH